MVNDIFGQGETFSYHILIERKKIALETEFDERCSAPWLDYIIKSSYV